MTPIVVRSDVPVFHFSRRHAPQVHADPGTTLTFVTGDAAYASTDGAAIDAGEVDFRRANALAGPVYLNGAVPGDALGFTIDSIEVGSRAFAVYVARWRRHLFGLTASHVSEVPIINGSAVLPGGGRIRARPMVGCCGIAPASGALSTLSPTSRTGGNMDLVELQSGATIWLPVEVAGGLLSLGDVHLRMGRAEPFGSGLECAGTVHGQLVLAPGRAPATPIVVDDERISFVGTGSDDREALEQSGRSAWQWLTDTCGVPIEDAMPICAGILELNYGGPAGSNVVAGFERQALRDAGVPPGVWPLVERRSELP